MCSSFRRTVLTLSHIHRLMKIRLRPNPQKISLRGIIQFHTSIAKSWSFLLFHIICSLIKTLKTSLSLPYVYLFRISFWFRWKIKSKKKMSPTLNKSTDKINKMINAKIVVRWCSVFSLMFLKWYIEYSGNILVMAYLISVTI